MKKPKSKTDDEIAALVHAKVKGTLTPGGSKLSKEREIALKYYNGELPLPMHGGDSKFVSRDVFEGVEGAKSMLLEAFSGGRRPIEFTPHSEADEEPARIQTAYCSKVLMGDNPALDIFSTTIMDGLMARVGVVKAYWKTCVEEEEEEFKGATFEDLLPLLDDEDNEIDENSIKIDEATQTVTGRVTRKVDKSRIVIENVRPEDFRIATGAKSLAKARFTADRSFKTRDELIEMGLTAEKIDAAEISFTAAPVLETEEIARNNETNDDNSAENDADTTEVWDIYIRDNFDGRTRLWNVVMCGSVLVSKKVVESSPYNTFAPIPIPHQFYGTSFVNLIKQTQAAMTVLIRSIVNHTLITNNPRWAVVKGALRTPRELMENKIGGIVNVDRPDGVFPLPQANLNPFVFELLRALDQKKEDTTGISRLSQGINKDAISKQNSAALVEQLASLSMQRTKIIARQFGEFVKSLYFTINRLVLDHEKRDRVVNVAGNWVDVNVAEWKDRQHCNIDLTLGYGELDKEFEQTLMIYQFMAGDPHLEPMFGPGERYALLKKALEKIGRTDFTRYLKDPKDVEPPPPNPMDELQVKMVEAQLEAQKSSTSLADWKAKSDEKLAQMRLELDRIKATGAHAIQADAIDVKEAQLAHDIEVDTAELELAKTATKLTAIASPGS